MATFDDGWICKNCWTANREQDVHCYRCKALSPDYHVVTQPPMERVPRTPRGPVLRRAARRATAGAIHLFTATMAYARTIGRGVGRAGGAATSSVAAVASAVGIAIGSLVAAILSGARSLGTALLAAAVAVGTAVLVGARAGAGFVAAMSAIAVQSTARAAVVLGHGIAEGLRSAGRGSGRLAAAGGSALNHLGSRLVRSVQTIGTNVRRLGTH